MLFDHDVVTTSWYLGNLGQKVSKQKPLYFFTTEDPIIRSG
jgi:hypothetical protein